MLSVVKILEDVAESHGEVGEVRGGLMDEQVLTSVLLMICSLHISVNART